MSTRAMKNIIRLLVLTAILTLGAASTQVVSAAQPETVTPEKGAVALPFAAPNAAGCSGQPTVQYAYANPPTINRGK